MQKYHIALFSALSSPRSNFNPPALWVDERHHLSVCWCGLLPTSPRSRVSSRALLSGPAYSLGSFLTVTEMSLTSAWRCQCSGEREFRPGQPCQLPSGHSLWCCKGMGLGVPLVALRSVSPLLPLRICPCHLRPSQFSSPDKMHCTVSSVNALFRKIIYF